MIAVTSNSLLPNSSLPPLPGAVECAFLEEVTGADVMIVHPNAEYPVRTRPLLRRHLEAGAILVQHKHKLDLIASFGERLDSEIARMCEVTRRQAQRVLLTIGTFYAREGELFLDGVGLGVPWATYEGAMQKWRGRGGCVENRPTASYIPYWCETQLRHLREYRAEPVKMVYAERARMPDALPEDGDPLQLCVRVEDARNLLLALPGCGPVIVEWLWKVSEGNAWLALQIATHSEWYKSLPDRPRNFGPAFIARAQKYLGMSEHAERLKALLALTGE